MNEKQQEPRGGLASRALKSGVLQWALFVGIGPPTAQAASGDLDPSFADHGRLESGLAPFVMLGAARSVEIPDAGDIFVAGTGVLPRSPGDWGVCAVGVSFTRRLDDAGSIDPTYGAERIDSMQALDIARQADGKVVAVGRSMSKYGGYGRCGGSWTSRLAVIRLESDGSIDGSFGDGGVFAWSADQASSNWHQAHSVSLDPSGRIVVAGVHNVLLDGEQIEHRVLVLRLLNDGSLDGTFGDGGIYVGPVVSRFVETRLVRTGTGRYRVLASGINGCTIVGLNAKGALDLTFGNAGVASVRSPGGNPVTCDSLEPIAGGGLFVAGSVAEKGFVARLLANGRRDSTFVADVAIAESMGAATAITPIADGRVLVAGSGPQGASITRLQADGTLDTSFGDAGRTWIDLTADSKSTPVIYDMAIRNDGGVVAAGGDSAGGHAFVVRLHGDSGGSSAGVLSFAGPGATPVESDGAAIVRVRRSGGSEGDLSVTYRTVENDNATAGEDFTPTDGILHWANGDRSVRNIAVEIALNEGPAEVPESFQVALADFQGGAGIGARNANVTIQADGFPAGQFAIEFVAGFYEEPIYQFEVSRNFDLDGNVCVDVAPRSGTATAGEDFEADSTSVCWADQEAGVKLVDIRIIDDNDKEVDETFTVELSNPTGGAIIGPLGSAVATIHANDDIGNQPPPQTGENDSGGGGPVGMVEALLLLGLVLLRRFGAKKFHQACMAVLGVGFCIAAPLTQAATGDLDPSFADNGRRAPIGKAGGKALFVESLGPDGILVGGGDVDISGSWRHDPSGFCSLTVSGSSFASRLGEDGSVHRLLDPATVENVEALALARQADGKIVVVGRSVRVSDFRCFVYYTPTVYRLNGDGSLDTSFGVRVLRGLTQAQSVALDPEGRIVVAGRRPIQDDPEGDIGLAVLRLRTDGRLDASFGNGGYFAGPVADPSGEIYFFGRFFSRPEIRLVRMDSGRFRVSFASEGDCKIVGVTANGGLDATFGSSGVVTLHGPDGSQVTCNALESDSQGRLLVSGSSGNHGFVARLLARGGVDPGFSADAAVAKLMSAVTSMAIAPDGNLLVAGSGRQGASIMRLQAAGGLDAAFGNSGQTWIDLKSKSASNPIVRDMLVREDGSVIVVGGAMSYDRPFVVRLLGEAGGASRGVIGFSRGHAAPVEADGKAILRVRRSGGRDGAVSASYRTVAFDATDLEDFVPESGTLEWADGDSSYKKIAIGLVEGGETAEALEAFHVVLEDIQGGAGGGTRIATVDIQPDGSPGGQLEIDQMDPTAHEQQDNHQVILRRYYYFEGRVCVTLTAKSGSATAGEDFSGEPVTACWNDQDNDETQLLDIPIFEDNLKEGLETFTLELSNPTGGAVIGPIGSVTINLRDND